MSIGTSLGGFYEDEHHFQSKAFREEKSDIQTGLDKKLEKLPESVDADMTRLPLEVSPETNRLDEMNSDQMMIQRSPVNDPKNIYNDAGNIVDYDTDGLGPALPLPWGQSDLPIKKSYNTPLTSDEQSKFKEWKTKNAPLDSGEDYDLQGAFKAGITPDKETGHWPDTYKKPNHPTFSDQSIYAKDRPDLAGSWDGEFYVPPSKKE